MAVLFVMFVIPSQGVQAVASARGGTCSGWPKALLTSRFNNTVAVLVEQLLQSEQRADSSVFPVTAQRAARRQPTAYQRPLACWAGLVLYGCKSRQKNQTGQLA